jgi:cell division protease FtsH
MKLNLLIILFIQNIITSHTYNILFKFSNNYNDINNIDTNNLEKLEKMFIDKKKYLPYKKNFYEKYQNKTDIYNIEKNKLNNKINIINITQLLEKYNNDFNSDFNSDYDFNNYDINNDFNKSKNSEINPENIYSNHDIRRMSVRKLMNNFYNNEKNNKDDDSKISSDSNFEIIKQSEYSFKNLGGYDKIKKELLQCADILINFTKYQKYNVRTPKGIIFEGPPGTGKTMFAKCFSGEINASFIPVSGSEFSEKYVGVGAKRIRDLFKIASKNKPCIIFIDEIDALARKRGNDMVSSNSEKDQTLNQLLVNLDGFKGSDGIFLIGATNRLDLLDSALLRPGRIDKNIYIGNPDSSTRKDIIKIHLKGKPIDTNIILDYIVEMTGGFSGAQIENLLNEAMLNALRENREIIKLDDLEFIANRIIAGWQATENKYSDDIINRIVIHELGHAILGFLSKEHPILMKVTLNLWSPKTPGYTVFESNDENNNIHTKNGLLSHLMVLLGGRIAEEIFYGYSVTTGAKKDLEQAYLLSKNMILNYGMGRQNIYPDLSDHSKYLIDQEINNLLLDVHDKATIILKKNKELIIDCSVILKKTNILKPDDIINIINAKYPEIWDMYDIRNNYD